MKVNTLNKANEINSKLDFISQQLIYLENDVVDLFNIKNVLSQRLHSKIKIYIANILKEHYEELKNEFENLN